MRKALVSALTWILVRVSPVRQESIEQGLVAGEVEPGYASTLWAAVVVADEHSESILMLNQVGLGWQPVWWWAARPTEEQVNDLRRQLGLFPPGGERVVLRRFEEAEEEEVLRP